MTTNRMILEWRGQTYRIKSCEECPARSKSEDGDPFCEIRGTRLRAHIKYAFPIVLGSKALGIIPCPVYPEGTKRVRPKAERIDKIPLHERPKISGVIYCSWCGVKVNPAKAVVIINDKEDGRIYDRFACLEQYLRTKDK